MNISSRLCGVDCTHNTGGVVYCWCNYVWDLVAVHASCAERYRMRPHSLLNAFSRYSIKCLCATNSFRDILQAQKNGYFDRIKPLGQWDSVMCSGFCNAKTALPVAQPWGVSSDPAQPMRKLPHCANQLEMAARPRTSGCSRDVLTRGHIFGWPRTGPEDVGHCPDDPGPEHVGGVESTLSCDWKSLADQRALRPTVRSPGDR